MSGEIWGGKIESGKIEGGVAYVIWVPKWKVAKSREWKIVRGKNSGGEMKSGKISGSRSYMANKTQDGDYLISCAYLPFVLCVVFTDSSLPTCFLYHSISCSREASRYHNISSE